MAQNAKLFGLARLPDPETPVTPNCVTLRAARGHASVDVAETPNGLCGKQPRQGVVRCLS
jgi:hypothetical protein